MKYPAVVITLVVAAGIVAAEFVELPLFGGFAFAIGIGLLAWFHQSWRPWLLYPLLFFAGYLNTAWRERPIGPLDLRRLLGEGSEIATIRGRLLDTPVPHSYVHDDEEIWRSSAFVEVHAVQFRGKPWQSACGRLLVSTRGLLPKQFFSGQPVEIYGVIQRPREAIAPGLFDYRAYLKRRYIHYQMFVSRTSDWRLGAGALPESAISWSDRFQQWARQKLAAGLPDDEALQLQYAMLIGWRTGMTSEVAEPFMRSGTMHIFAISGLHVGFIAAALVALARMVMIPRQVCGVVVIPLLWFYTAAIGWQPSAVRSTLMATVLIAGWALQRPVNLLNSLFMAALIIILWDPQQLFQTSFQLSFAAVLSIALLIPPIEKARELVLQNDALLPQELWSAWRRRLDKIIHYISAGAVTSLAAFLGTAPVIAWYFHLVSPVSLLANLLIVPLSAGVMTCGMASIGFSTFWPWAAELYNNAGWLLMKVMSDLSRWFADIPGSYYYVARPGLLEFVLYYTTLAALFAGGLQVKRWRLWTIALLSCTVIAIAAQQLAAYGARSMTVLPLNGGFSVLVQNGSLKDGWLVDCGREEFSEMVVRPFLRAQGIQHLRGLALTHGDIRQIGGASVIEMHFAPEHVYASPLRFRSAPYREYTASLEKRPGFLQYLSRGNQFGPLSVLHPDANDRFAQADDGALVFMGQMGKARVLLLSDLGRHGQSALMERNSDADLQADIVICGLPNDGEPLMNPLLRAVRPRIIIVADSLYPASRRASRALRQRLERCGIPVLCTHECGAVTLEFKRYDWRLKTMSGLTFDSRKLERMNPKSWSSDEYDPEEAY